MDHSAVLQAVTFAVPHARLGEDVAAAVILREGVFATENNIQLSIVDRLAHFKIPHRILIVNEIPKGPTGKIQRIGLAEKLGMTMDSETNSQEKAEFVEPGTTAEKKLAEIWEQVIGIQGIGIRDNFFEIGGDSILAAQMFAQVAKAFGKNLPITTLLQAPNIEQLAYALDKEGRSASMSSMVEIQPEGSRPPFFCIHGCLGEVMNYFDLANHLGQDQPFYALRARGIYGEKNPHKSFEEMAAHYIKEIQTIQPEGPYLLGGSGNGALIALEVARQLSAQAQKVDLLVLMDPIYYDLLPSRQRDPRPKSTLVHYIYRLRHHLRQEPPKRALRHIAGVTRKWLRNQYRKRIYWEFAYSFIPRHIGFIQRRIRYMDYVRYNLARATWRYNPKSYPGRITYFLSEIRAKEVREEWHQIAEGGLDVQMVPGYHTGMLREPYVKTVAEKLKICLDNSQN